MSDTPRTDAARHPCIEMQDFGSCDFARDMERELAAANERIRRLEEALDTLTLVVGLTPIAGNKQALQEALDIARSMLRPKEAKP